MNLSSLTSLQAGGKSGSLVAEGDANNSELYLRISLPNNHEDFMPAEGKIPLTGAQREIIRWWINAGLPVNASVESMTLETDVLVLLAVELDLEEAGVTPSYALIPAEVLVQLGNQGFLVRQLSQESNGLMVSINSRGLVVNRQMLETLAAARESIVDLNLANSGLSDDLLNLLVEMPVLARLNLSNNGITDSGLQSLSSSQTLRALNLYGNSQITDAGLAQLAALIQLQTFYLWGTSVSEAGMAAF